MTRWAIPILAVAATFARADSLKPTVTPPRITGWLHTQGTQILDESDKPVRLLGMGGPNLAAGQRPSKTQYDNISDWGFNTVRVIISWGNLEPTAPTKNADGTLTHHWNQAFLSTLDDVLSEYGKRHVGVILTMAHGRWFVGPADSEFPTWLYESTAGGNQFRRDFLSNTGAGPVKPLDGFTEAWKTVAKRYADNPALTGIDIMTEPGYKQGDHLEAFYATVAKGIRSVNPHVLIMFEDMLPFRRELVLRSPPPVENVVYSVHLYAKDWSHDGKPWMEMVSKQAEEWKVPVYVGEFNAFKGGLNVKNLPANWQPETKMFLDYCKAHDVSWSFFTYEASGPAFSSIIVPDTGEPKADLLAILQAGF